MNLWDRPEGVSWQLGRYLPNGRELAEYLAGIFYYPESSAENLLRVSQYAVAKDGLGPLYDELRKLFDANYPPTRVHTFFASLPRTLSERGSPHHQVIMTTNYDE